MTSNSRLHPIVETALLGAASFLNSDRTKAWLASKIENAAAHGSNFNVDYIIRVRVPADGEPSVQLMTQPNNLPIQLASWGQDVDNNC